MCDPLPTHEEIARFAYAIYLQEGCPLNRALEHWLEAEEQLTVDTLYDAFVDQPVSGDHDEQPLSHTGALR